jgi:uncharacterized membrane protein
MYSRMLWGSARRGGFVMFSMYALLKFLHVAGAIAWVGGATTMSILYMQLIRSRDRAALGAFFGQSLFIGRTFVGPAAMLTLLAGIATTIVGGLSFGAFWITWGFVGIVGSVVLGAVLISRTAGEIAKVSASETPDTARLGALQGRLALLNTINVLLLLSVVAAMVFKPVF